MIGRLGLKRLLIGCLAHLSKITGSELMVTDLKSSLDLGFLAWNSKLRINGSQNRTSDSVCLWPRVCKNAMAAES